MLTPHQELYENLPRNCECYAVTRGDGILASITTFAAQRGYRAFVHWLGAPMARGAFVHDFYEGPSDAARAVANAANCLPDNLAPEHVPVANISQATASTLYVAFKRAITRFDGFSFATELRTAGFTVHRVL